MLKSHFEIIEVILRRFLCKKSKHYSLILAITFYEVKVKEKKLTFLCNAAKKVLLLMNFSLSGDNCLICLIYKEFII